MGASLNKHKEGLGCSPGRGVTPAQAGLEGGAGDQGRWARAGGGGAAGTTPTILENELVMGRDREEPGLVSMPSSSCPLPVLKRTGQERWGERGGDKELRAMRH